MRIHPARFSASSKRLRTPMLLLMAVLSSALACTGRPAQGGLIFVSSRAELGANDFVDWSTLGPNGTTLTPPFTINSNGGLGVDVSVVHPSVGSTLHRVRDFSGPAFETFWNVGTPTGVERTTFHQLRLDFDRPVSAFGADFQAFSSSVLPGEGSATVQILSATGSLLGEVSLPENTGGERLQFGPLFVGGVSDMTDISAVVLSYEATNSGGRFDTVNAHLLVNRVDLLVSSTANPVPEPSSMALLASGFAGLGGLVVRRRRRAAQRG